MASLASSSPTRRRVTLTAALLVSVLAVGCESQPSGGVAQGHALNGGMQSTGRVGIEHAQLGEVFWAALPLPNNTSKDSVAINKARFTEIPKGLKVGEYRIFNATEAGGIYLLAYTGGKYGTKDPEKLTNYAGKPIQLKANQESDYYFAAKVTVTGPIHKDLGGCSFWYKQNGKEYKQNLSCQTTIRIGKPLPGDS